MGPLEDNDASEPADAIASAAGYSGVQGALDDVAEAFSFDADLRSAWVKPTERGLKGKPDLLEDDGELVSLRLRALEKLHFFEGVFTTGDDFSPALNVDDSC